MATKKEIAAKRRRGKRRARGRFHKGRIVKVLGSATARGYDNHRTPGKARRKKHASKMGGASVAMPKCCYGCGRSVSRSGQYCGTC